MENTEIMTNNEVIETVEEITSTSSGNGLKLFGGGLAAVALGYGAYKLIKKLAAKRKERKDMIYAETCDLVDEDVDSFDEV